MISDIFCKQHFNTNAFNYLQENVPEVKLKNVREAMEFLRATDFDLDKFKEMVNLLQSVQIDRCKEILDLFDSVKLDRFTKDLDAIQTAQLNMKKCQVCIHLLYIFSIELQTRPVQPPTFSMRILEHDMHATKLLLISNVLFIHISFLLRLQAKMLSNASECDREAKKFEKKGRETINQIKVNKTELDIIFESTKQKISDSVQDIDERAEQIFAGSITKIQKIDDDLSAKLKAIEKKSSHLEKRRRNLVNQRVQLEKMIKNVKRNASQAIKIVNKKMHRINRKLDGIEIPSVDRCQVSQQLVHHMHVDETQNDASVLDISVDPETIEYLEEDKQIITEFVSIPNVIEIETCSTSKRGSKMKKYTVGKPIQDVDTGVLRCVNEGCTRTATSKNYANLRRHQETCEFNPKNVHILKEKDKNRFSHIQKSNEDGLWHCMLCSTFATPRYSNGKRHIKGIHGKELYGDIAYVLN